MGEAKANLEAKKKKKFEETPEKFIDQDTVVVCATVDSDDGIRYLINPNQAKHIPSALGSLNLEAPFVMQFVKTQAMQKIKNGIITPGDNGKSRFDV